MTELLHITERTVWTAAVGTGEYRMSTRDVTLEQEGFIHCSLRHQLRGVAELVYADADDLVVLVIDSDRLTAPVRIENTFPHIYGPLPTSAVTDVIDVHRDETGRLVLPA